MIDSDSEEILSEAGVSDFICIDSPKFMHRRVGSFTPTPSSPVSFQHSSKNIIQSVNGEASNEDDGYSNDNEPEDNVTKEDGSFIAAGQNLEDEHYDYYSSPEGFVKYANAPAKRNHFAEILLAFVYIMMIFTLAPLAIIHFDKSPRRSHSKNIQLVTWKAYNETNPLMEDLFFEKTEIKSGLNLPSCLVKIRPLSTETAVFKELLPSGKERIYLDVYEPKSITVKYDKETSLMQKRANEFYVLCEGEQMKCRCVRIVVMSAGKEPKIQRRCICEPLNEGEMTFEMTMTSTSSTKMGLALQKFTSVAVFVSSFNKYLHFTYKVLLDAGRTVKNVAFTIKNSTKLTFTRFKVSIVDRYQKCEPRPFYDRTMKSFKGKTKGAWKKVRSLSSRYKFERTFGKYQDQFNKAKCQATLQIPKVKEYWSRIKTRLVRA